MILMSVSIGSRFLVGVSDVVDPPFVFAGLVPADGCGILPEGEELLLRVRVLRFPFVPQGVVVVAPHGPAGLFDGVEGGLDVLLGGGVLLQHEGMDGKVLPYLVQAFAKDVGGLDVGDGVVADVARLDEDPVRAGFQTQAADDAGALPSVGAVSDVAEVRQVEVLLEVGDSVAVFFEKRADFLFGQDDLPLGDDLPPVQHPDSR